MNRKLESSHTIEREKWDAMAQAQAEDAERLPPHPEIESYLAQSTTFEGAAGFLGDLRGKRVLDYGSGVGMTAALLAKSEVLGQAIAESLHATRRRRAVSAPFPERFAAAMRSLRGHLFRLTTIQGLRRSHRWTRVKAR